MTIYSDTFELEARKRSLSHSNMISTQLLKT